MISTTDLDLGAAVGSSSASTPSSPAARKPHPCDSCKRSKLKCDQRRPTCDTCEKRAKPCNYSAADEYTDGRVRKFHRRSRKGCSHCKARRVRCDEVKPVCGGCRRKGAAELCIFPADTGQSSASRSPSPARASAAAQPASTFASANAPVSTDYFTTSQADSNNALLGLSNTLPTDNNAVSLWNPMSTSVPSPNTLLASFFNQQPHDLFGGNPFDQGLQSHALSQDPLKSQLYANVDFSLDQNHNHNQMQVQTQPQVDTRDRMFFNFNGIKECPSPATATNGGAGATFDPFSLADTTAPSSDSTPISLNSNTAYTSSFANFIQPEYRNRPEHPAYLYQLGMIDNPDQLSPYFPTLEQRHQASQSFPTCESFHSMLTRQYRHFFQETSKSLLVTPVPQAENPFLCHFSHLAFGAPAGQSLSHDAFRFALLSLASLDIGIKMSMAMPGMSQNAMYAISDEQRAESNKRLIACDVSGILKEDATDAEMAIATTVALSIRDRLAGCQEWEPPLKTGRDVVVDSGGPAAFINARPTADRRFLVEQMAILELIGYLTIWVSPKIFSWENEWFRFVDNEEGRDHLQVIYGWTRDAIVYCIRSMILCGEARDIEALREAQPKPGYRQLKQIIEARTTSLMKRVRNLLPDGETVKANVLLSLASPEVVVGVLGIQACMDLCLRTVILMESIASPAVQDIVKSILDISDGSISRGRYAGLLLPLSWADGVAHDAILKPRAKATLRSLKGHYHLNQDLLERIINIDWATLNDIGLSDWESFLREHGYYVPCF